MKISILHRTKILSLVVMACMLFCNSVWAQTVIFQSGFETGDPAFLYRAGSINTPVQATTGGSSAPYCGSFTSNGKYDGAFATGTALNFTLNKYYTISGVYRVATCVGALKLYRSTTAGTFANITAGTLLSTITTNQTAYIPFSYSFKATVTQSAFIGFVATMTANGCNSANFWMDDVIITEYDYPPCGVYCPTGYATALTSYVSNVVFNTISRPSGWDGYICTGEQTSVDRTVSYNLALTYHNQTVSQKFVAAWIDFNQDADFADPGEQVLVNTDITTVVPPIDQTINQNITIPAGATLGMTKMRVALVVGTSAQTIPCSPNTVLSDFEDYDININPAPVPMTYVSSTTTQTNTTGVNAGSFNNEIIGLQVVTTGTLTPISATSFTFNTAGTTSPAADISTARLWYTSNNATFGTTMQVGSPVAGPNGTYSFTGSVQLIQGTNYFWITYDIPVGATSPDVLDATCTSVTVAAVPRTPTVTVPAGNRPVITATPMVYVSSTVTQNVSRTPRPDTNHQIIGIEIVTTGASSPLSTTSFSFNTTGTSATVTNNIQNARLWSTGTSPSFVTTTQIGATVATPNGVFTITPSFALLNGTNYFWLTYDIPVTAGCDPAQVDAQCTSITIGGTPRVPIVTSPLGAVVIDCLTGYYSKGSLPANLANSWNTKRDGTGTDASSFGLGSMFYVQNGHIMNTTAPQTIPFMTIESGGRVNASFLITMNDLRINSFGTFEQIVQAATGTYITNFYIENYGTWIHNNAGALPSMNHYFSPRSNQWFYQWGSGTFPLGTAWGNVLLNGTTTGNFGMGNCLNTIQGDFEWRRIGNNNYLLDEMDETINVGGNLIFSGGWWKTAYDNSIPGNQTRTVIINVAGDFIMTSGKLEDYARGDAASGTTLNINGNVIITGGTLNFNLSPSGASPINLAVGNPTMTWQQTGGTVTIGNTNVKAGKTAYMTGSKLGDIGTARALTVETGAKLYASNYPVTGAGNFTLQTGAWLGIGSAAGITASGATGNVQVAGTRSYNSGATYEYYEGLTPQSTGNFTTTSTSANYPAQVANLVVNKTSASDIVNLTNTTDVIGNLALTNGIIKSSLVAATAPWIRIPSAATVTPAGGSANSYVDGYIRRQGATAFTFPTGNGGRWRRIAITAPSISTELEACYVGTPYANTTSMAIAPLIALDHVSKLEHWFLTKPLGADAATTKVKLHWENASMSGILKFDSLAVARWNGSAWENSNCYSTCPVNWTSSTAERTYTGTASGTGAGTIQSNTTSTFGPFTISAVGVFQLNPLPVELLDASLTCNNNDFLIQWATATEQGSDYFVLERSSNGFEFEEIARLDGAGNSTELKQYSYLDVSAPTGIQYYRLSQTDYNGESMPLKVIAGKCADREPTAVNAFNNHSGQLVVNISASDAGNYFVTLYDALGQEINGAVFEVQQGISNHELDITGLGAGVYFVTIYSTKLAVTRQVLID